MLSVAERALRHWVHRYNDDGLTGLADRRAGRRCRLSADQLECVRERIRAGSRPQDGVCSLRGRDLRRILWQEFQVRYARSSVYYLLHHQVGMRYLKPCPMHRKTDPAAQVAFKKSSLKRSKKSSSRMRTNALRYGSRMKVASGNRGR